MNMPVLFIKVMFIHLHIKKLKIINNCLYPAVTEVNYPWKGDT